MARNRIVLTDKFCSSPKQVPTTGRAEHYDALVPGLCLRVTETGHRSFCLVARYPSHPVHPSRRALGTYGAITLEEARDMARDWLRLIRRGIDPKVELAKERAANQRKQVFTFAYVLEEFLTRDASKHVKAKEARRLLTKELPKSWLSRPVVDIQPTDCAAAIRAIVKRGAQAQAHNVFAYTRRLFNWAIGVHEFGLDRSPMERLKPADLIGQRNVRDRTLEDHELKSVWDAAGQMGYPFGAIMRMLILTGGRLREVAELSWKEVDLEQQLIMVPGRRMKGNREHAIPLAPMAMELLSGLPHFRRGDYVFTSTSGVKPFTGFSKSKSRLNELSGVGVGDSQPWVLHDARRTMRSHLSALPIEDRVREQMIAHAQPGLHAVYDKFKYTAEKKRGFELYEQRLLGIVKPPAPATVTDLTAVRRKRLPA